VLATDNNTVGMGDAGIKSAIQGSNVPNPDEAVPSFVSGAMAKAGKGLRYHDVISSFGGKTSYDADNRPLLVMRSNLWASGYDVDGTDQTSLGQFSGRVQQTYKHSVPRFFVPE